MNNESSLVSKKVSELISEGMLPSGNPFELEVDSVGNMEAVASAKEDKFSAEKALKASKVVKTVGGVPMPKADRRAALTFVNSMLDVDVQFLSIAWMVQLHGDSIELDDGSAACPNCMTPIPEVPIVDVEFTSRLTPASGVSSFHRTDIVADESWPKSVQGHRVVIVDPTWAASKSRLDAETWTNSDIVNLHRLFACIRVQNAETESAPRMMSRKAEFENLRSKHVKLLDAEIDKFVPSLNPVLVLSCKACGEEIKIPFDQGI